VNELAVRTVTGVVLIAAVLLAAIQGGNVFAILVAAIATLMFYEWTRIVRGWGIDALAYTFRSVLECARTCITSAAPLFDSRSMAM
jgi:CDP-diglyceride synthetase